MPISADSVHGMIKSATENIYLFFRLENCGRYAIDQNVDKTVSNNQITLLVK